MTDTAKVLAEATPRPWTWEGNYVFGPSMSFDQLVMDDGSAGGEYAEKIRGDEPNGKLIVLAVNAYEADQERIAKLEEALNRARVILVGTGDPSASGPVVRDTVTVIDAALSLSLTPSPEASHEHDTALDGQIPDGQAG